MKMVAHQTVGVHLPAAPWAGGSQGGEKALSIQVVPKNLFTPIAPAHQMIDCSLVLDSQLARHRQLFDPIIDFVSIVRTSLKAVVKYPIVRAFLFFVK
jgi:hypothetical protein